MKTPKLPFTFFAIVLFTSFQLSLTAQGISKQERLVKPFTGIEVGGATEVVLMAGPRQTVILETDADIQDRVKVYVERKTLKIKLSGVKKYGELKLYITTDSLEYLGLSGAAELKSLDTLHGKQLKLILSGAAEAQLLLDYAALVTKASGAAEARLLGKASVHTLDVSGAAEIHAKELKTTTTVANASGAGSCYINAKTNLTYQVSGAGEVHYVNKPTSVIIEKKNNAEQIVIISDSSSYVSTYVHDDPDTTSVHVGSLHVEVVDGDTTKIQVGSNVLIVDDDGNVRWERAKKPRFNGHWGGVELGINGYVTPDFNTNWDPQYDYLNLRYEKSIAVNLNIYEQNIALNKAKNIGLITGVGMAWNNYRFSSPTYLDPNSTELEGYFMEGVSVRKSKLTAMYITVPLIFEVQTKHPRRIKRFFFSAGGVVSARVRTHTKIYFDEANKSYRLRIPATDPPEYLDQTYVTPGANDRNIIKSYDSFYLQPFKFDATVRMGYGIISVFGTYSINPVFQSGRGPKLYAWSLGISLIGW